MFSNLRLKFGLSRLYKLQKGVIRHKMVHNLESARNVGILFYASNDEVFDQTMQLASFLNDKQIKVSIVAYCPEKEVPQKYFLRKNVKVFTRKELNWYGKPLVPIAQDFADDNFDILIDLSMQEVFPLRWIASLSRAKFKVGTLSYYGNPNDLIISLKQQQTIDYFIAQLKHYLNIINNRFAQQQDWVITEQHEV